MGCTPCERIKQIRREMLGNEIAAKDTRCRDVTIVDKETGNALDGTLCESEDGIKFVPAPIKIDE